MRLVQPLKKMQTMASLSQVQGLANSVPSASQTPVSPLTASEGIVAPRSPEGRTSFNSNSSQAGDANVVNSSELPSNMAIDQLDLGSMSPDKRKKAASEESSCRMR